MGLSQRSAITSVIMIVAEDMLCQIPIVSGVWCGSSESILIGTTTVELTGVARHDTRNDGYVSILR